MKAYLTYFKNQMIIGLQYRAAALGGLATQFFWGLFFVFIYEAFYSYTSIDSINYKELMCYVWLGQAFFSLTLPSFKDREVLEGIKNGTVAYELTRPYNLYTWWYLKQLSKRYAACILRFLPIIIFSLLLPKPYNLALPISLNAFILFLITLLLGSFITASLDMLVLIISFFTYDEKGISSIVVTVTGLLAGFFIPLPLLPSALEKICNYLPFSKIFDLSYRVYSGNIGCNRALNDICIQLVWILILILIGKIIMKKALKKVEVQGG